MADESATAMLDGLMAATEEKPKLEQEVEISDVGPCKKHVKVTIPRSAIDARLDEKFSELMVGEAKAQIPGFRAGKAPKEIVRRKFFKEVASEVRTQILLASLEQLAEQQSLSPLSPPQLDPKSVVIPEKSDEPMIYEFDIEVRPEFDLPDYKGLKLRRPVYTFTDADVAKERNKLLERLGTIVPKDGPIALDDIVTADITISRDGKELNTVQDVRLRVEKRLALEDGVASNFGEAMAGAVVGDTREVAITLSQGLANPELRGQSVSAQFTVKDVKHIRLPELTAEHLEAYGVRSEEALEELIRARLERLLEVTQRRVARTELLEKLASGQKWDLPQDMLERQARKTLERRVMEMRDSGLTEEQIVGQRRLLQQDALRTTAAALKEHFVLQKIAEIEKIEIEDDDIDKEIEFIADRSGESFRKVKAKLEREDLIETLATELLERRALELVLQTAEYDDYTENPLQAEDDGAVSTIDASAMKDEPAA